MSRTPAEQKEYLRLYYLKNKEKSKAASLAYRLKNKEAISANGKKKYLEKIGRTEVEQRQLTTEVFIERARATHGERYQYHLVEYQGQTKNVRIVCPEHGEFSQLAGNHMAGKGCGKCGRRIVENSRKLDPKDFLKRASAIHGDALLFDDANYTGWESRVAVTCPEHGTYMALPSVLLRGGKGCEACAVRERGPSLLSKDQFVERALTIHGEKYSYENVHYIGFLKNVEITCKDHGSFLQTPGNHISGKGCPKCSGSQSRPEQELLEWIRRTVQKVEVLERQRNVIPPYELDVYIPSLKIAIEFNGLYWHSGDKATDSEFRNKHVRKLQMCQKAGVRLVQIREDRYAMRPEICRSIIGSALFAPSRKENARSCKVVSLRSIDATDFLLTNHLDGSAKASVCLGLELDGELLSVMTFAKPRYSSEAEWELVRFASKPFVHVRGAASKLMAHFRLTNPGRVISYCNLEYGSGGVYRAIGMDLISQSRPGYVWVKNGQRAYSRYQTQKHKLSALLPNFDPSLSESDNMFANGFRRYWDSGNLVFMTSN